MSKLISRRDFLKGGAAFAAGTALLGIAGLEKTAASAEGNVQGDRFSHEYPITLKGVSHSLAMYYGYVAGKNAVEGI